VSRLPYAGPPRPEGEEDRPDQPRRPTHVALGLLLIALLLGSFGWGLASLG
jgi:hypothetical protein